MVRHILLPWLPLASALAVPEATIVAIRYRDADKMWRLVRQCSPERWTIHYGRVATGKDLLSTIGSAGSSPFVHGRFGSRCYLAHKGNLFCSQESHTPLKRWETVWFQVPSIDDQVTRLLCWLLTQNYAFASAEVRHSASSANPP